MMPQDTRSLCLVGNTTQMTEDIAICSGKSTPKDVGSHPSSAVYQPCHFGQVTSPVWPLVFSATKWKRILTENLNSKWSLKSLFSHCSSSFLIISWFKSRTFRAEALSPQSEQPHNQWLFWRGKPRSSEKGTEFPMLPIANPCHGTRRQVIENQAVPLRALCLSWSHRMPLHTGPPSHFNLASKDRQLWLFCALHQNHKYPTSLSREKLEESLRYEWFCEPLLSSLNPTSEPTLSSMLSP